MKIAIYKNKYYTDDGMDYCILSLANHLSPHAEIIYPKEFVVIDNSFKEKRFDGAIFWDKDVSLAYILEKSGTRVFNNAAAIENCDSKQKTAIALFQKEIMPKTLFAPLCYDFCTATDFLCYVKSELQFPFVAKLAYGSQGKQVKLLQNENDLDDFYRKNQLTPHLYQQFLKGGQGKDYRIYTVGKKAVYSAMRENDSVFTSNIATGGKLKPFNAPQRLKDRAEKISHILNLDYGAIDFVFDNDEYYFIEANSNAYFRAAEQNGAEIAKKYSQHILEVLTNA